MVALMGSFYVSNRLPVAYDLCLDQRLVSLSWPAGMESLTKKQFHLAEPLLKKSNAFTKR
jgi:hypothetical protein